jgi:hypothetical protein
MSSPIRVAFATRTPAFKVQRRQAQQFWVVPKMPNADVASHAESATHMPRIVVMIDGKSIAATIWLSANDALRQRSRFSRSWQIRNAFGKVLPALVLTTTGATPRIQPVILFGVLLKELQRGRLLNFALGTG